MTAPGTFSGRPVLAVLTALALLAAVVGLVVLVRDSNSEPTPSTQAVESSSDAPADEHDHEDGEHEDGEHEGEEGDHEHDHVDTVDPGIDPAGYVPFCSAFHEFADAYSSAAETLNAGGDAPGFLVAAATDFRAVAATTEMDDDVRVGFEWFVDDVLRVPNDASAEEQLAWSTFLNSACPA